LAQPPKPSPPMSCTRHGCRYPVEPRPPVSSPPRRQSSALAPCRRSPTLHGSTPSAWEKKCERVGRKSKSIGVYGGKREGTWDCCVH
jgi:hypothetical protein